MAMLNGSDENQIIVTVAKDELLVILKENRVKHIADFNAAVVEWKKVLIEETEKLFSELQKHQTAFINDDFSESNFMLRLDLPRPTSHEGDYNDAIRMLELHREDTLKLGYSAYKKYVNDEWSWKRHFETIKGQYSR